MTRAFRGNLCFAASSPTLSWSAADLFAMAAAPGWSRPFVLPDVQLKPSRDLRLRGVINAVSAWGGGPVQDRTARGSSGPGNHREPAGAGPLLAASSVSERASEDVDSKGVRDQLDRIVRSRAFD